MRIAVIFTKEAPVMFVSHLDVQRLFQRAFRRAKLPLAFSQGFNPHPLVSFATALSVGMTSRGEYLDVILAELMELNAFKEAVSMHLPEGVRIVDAIDLGESRKSLTSAMRSADYTAEVTFSREYSGSDIADAIRDLTSGPIVVQKKTKGGIKPTDIRPMVKDIELSSVSGAHAVFAVKGALTAEGGLNPDTLLRCLFDKLGCSGSVQIERTKIEMDIESILI